MKLSKRILGIILVGSLFLLSGCSLFKKSNLICKTNESGIDVEFNLDFIGNTLNGMKLDYVVDLSKHNDTQVETLKNRFNCEEVKATMGQLKNTFINCNKFFENNKIRISIDIDVDKLSQEERKKLISIDNSKQHFKSLGYTCTLE